MNAVVQATCPGCKNVLRIPAEWLATPIRCKHCGTVLMPRPAEANSTPTGQTPPPKKKKGPPPLVPTPAPQGGQPARKTPPVVPVPPGSSAPLLAQPTAEVPVAAAVPVTPPVPTPAQGTAKKKRRANAFEDLAQDEDDSPVSRVRNRRGKGSWVPLVAMVFLLGLGGTAVALFWPQLRAVLEGKNPGTIALGGENGEGERPPATTANTDNPPGQGRDPGTGPGTATNPPRDPGPGTAPPVGTFPRRALIISVHNYLYANLIHSGPPLIGAHNIPNFANALNRGLRFPLNQVAHLSDAAAKNQARPPLKSVIEKTYTDFLEGSRGQDRVVVFLVGHTAEIDDKVYFVPIDGELEVAEGLIPMSWFLEKMAACKARQRLLVVDVNRENPTYGRERPASGPMTEKLEALLKAPPAGVQVWSACSKDGLSYETDDSQMGVFLDSIWASIQPDKPGKGLQGKIQRPNDMLPLAELTTLVNKEMKEALEPLGLKQTCFLAGADEDNGIAYDPKEPLPADPVLARAPVQNGGAATIAAIKGVLDDIVVPPIKVTKADNKINYAMLPPLNGAMGDYQSGGEPTKLREQLKRARAVLWAVADVGDVPSDLKTLVDTKRQELKVNLSVLQDGYSIPANENMFKTRVENDERQVAVILGALTEAHEELKDMMEMKEQETKRWQANFDFILAHLEAQIAYLYEYQSMLGQMRKELPAHDPKIHKGWKLASRTELTGDSTGKKLAKSANRTLTTLAEELKGTPWEILAKREKLTALGMEWVAAR